MAFPSTKKSNVLLTLGVLFTLGAATRLVPTTLTQATAAESTETATATTAEASAADAAAFVASPEGQVCFGEDLSAQLASDQLRLKTESEQLEERQLELAAWEAELTQTSADLTALQASLETRWQDMQSFANEDLNHLAQMYGAMKPDQAATIFDQMDPGFAAGFLRLLSSEQAGLILASMESQQAYVVSVRLASLNEDLRREEY